MVDDTTWNKRIGKASALDISASTPYNLTLGLNASTGATVFLYVEIVNAGSYVISSTAVSNIQPFTWAVGDMIYFELLYETT